MDKKILLILGVILIAVGFFARHYMVTETKNMDGETYVINDYPYRTVSMPIFVVGLILSIYVVLFCKDELMSEGSANKEKS